MDGLGFLQSLTADKGHAETITEDDTKLKAKHDAMNKIKNQELNIQSQFNSEFSYTKFTLYRFNLSFRSARSI